MKKIYSLLILIFVIQAILLPVTGAAAVGENCNSAQDCDANNMCVRTSNFGAKKCYPKLGGGCNANADCDQIAPQLQISGAFCNSVKPVSGYSGTCQTNQKQYECTWKIEGTLTNLDNGSSQIIGGCSASIEKSSDRANCNPEVRPDTSASERLMCCCPVAVEGTSVTKAKFQIPIMSIPIDTVELTDAYCTNQADHSGTCEIPWIAQYIQGIYKYGLGVGGILAAIVLMAGGLLWLVSAGDASKISQAKDLILGSVTGLIILMGTYLILDQINPGLNNLKSISLNILETTNFSDAEVSTPDDQAENPYQEGCTAARNGDLSICRGYGEQEPGKMMNIAGTNLKAKSEVVEKYNAAMACVREKNGGKNMFGVSAAWRSPARQISIKAEKGTQAATPCCSNHGKGVALDLHRLDGKKMTWDNNDSSGLTACMNAQGLYAKLTTSPNEPWHWSPSGR